MSEKKTETKKKTEMKKETVKLKVKTKYNDLEIGRIVAAGEELEVTVERALVLLDKGLVNLNQ